MNPRVVWALVLRYLFLYSRTWVRLGELVFWPVMELMVWGFLAVFLRGEAGEGLPHILGYLLGAMLLWDVLFRAQQGVAISFLEDVWTNNLLNVFVAPVQRSTNCDSRPWLTSHCWKGRATSRSRWMSTRKRTPSPSPIMALA